ncbi:hypothetical protein [Kitasatospora sp. NBC_00315]|uniref:hypothetical protein n=1 Tax=Kitasatospora sp. NBC_00315 TaxID=2975963 RepID=UPI003251B9A7
MRGTRQIQSSPDGRGPVAALWQDAYAVPGPPPPAVRGITGSARSWGRVAEELADVGIVLPALHSVVRRPAARTVPAVPGARKAEYRAS